MRFKCQRISRLLQTEHFNLLELCEGSARTGRDFVFSLEAVATASEKQHAIAVFNYLPGIIICGQVSFLT